MDEFRFRPRKRSPAAYFNNGNFTYWVQAAKDRAADPQLLAAIDAAAREFNRVWFSKPPATTSAEAPVGADAAALESSPAA